jgi:hypothetical protein
LPIPPPKRGRRPKATVGFTTGLRFTNGEPRLVWRVASPLFGDRSLS